MALCLNFQNFYLPRSKQDESCYPHLSLAHVREVVTTFVFGSCYSFLDSFLVDSLDKVNTFILPLCLLSMVHIPYDLLCIQYKSFNLVNYTLIKDIGSNMSRAMLLFQFSIKITWFNLVNRYLNLSHLKYKSAHLIKQFGLLDWNIVSVVLVFGPSYSIIHWTEQTFDLQSTNLTRQEDKYQFKLTANLSSFPPSCIRICPRISMATSLLLTKF